MGANRDINLMPNSKPAKAKLEKALSPRTLASGNYAAFNPELISRQTDEEDRL